MRGGMELSGVGGFLGTTNAKKASSQRLRAENAHKWEYITENYLLVSHFLFQALVQVTVDYTYLFLPQSI